MLLKYVYTKFINALQVSKNLEAKFTKVTSEESIFSPNIIRAINSRRMIWAEHTARMRETRNVHKVLVENIKG
jgi:hypothetical protein